MIKTHLRESKESQKKKNVFNVLKAKLANLDEKLIEKKKVTKFTLLNTEISDIFIISKLVWCLDIADGRLKIGGSKLFCHYNFFLSPKTKNS
jgi:hypothetical protein